MILFIEGQQSDGRPLDADNLVLKAIPLMYSMERDRYETAGRLIADALRADNTNANVLAWAAFWQVWHVGQGWAGDPGGAWRSRRIVLCGRSGSTPKTPKRRASTATSAHS